MLRLFLLALGLLLVPLSAYAVLPGMMPVQGVTGEPPEPPPPCGVHEDVVYWTQMTAGNQAGLIFGYGVSTSPFPMGSINQEPVPEEELSLVMYDPDLAVFSDPGFIGFRGDLTTHLDGLTVWVNDTAYAADYSCSYDGGDDVTSCVWSDNEPAYANGITYCLEWRE